MTTTESLGRVTLEIEVTDKDILPYSLLEPLYGIDQAAEMTTDNSILGFSAELGPDNPKLREIFGASLLNAKAKLHRQRDPYHVPNEGNIVINEHRIVDVTASDTTINRLLGILHDLATSRC